MRPTATGWARWCGCSSVTATKRLLAALLLVGWGMGLRAGPAPVWMDPVTPPATAAATATPALVAITSPAYGAVLRGTVTIHGRARVPHARQVVLELSYVPHTDVWFPLAQWSPPPAPGPLWTWDTTTVADGTYWLRLRVTLDDGRSLAHALPVQVRNRTAAEPTPTRTGPQPPTPPSPRPPTPTVTPWPTPPAQALPAANPAALDWATWQQAARGAGLVSGAVVLLFLLRRRR